MVSGETVLGDADCELLRSRILESSSADIVRYDGGRSFVPTATGDVVSRLVRSNAWRRIEKQLVDPIYAPGTSYELVSVAGFVVEPGAGRQDAHTDLNLGRVVSRTNQAVVAVHIPLTATSASLGGTQYRKLSRGTETALATVARPRPRPERPNRPPGVPQVWGRRGQPYSTTQRPCAMCAAQSADDRRRQRRAVARRVGERHVGRASRARAQVLAG